MAKKKPDLADSIKPAIFGGQFFDLPPGKPNTIPTEEDLLDDPAFRSYLRERFPPDGVIEPEGEDIQPKARPATDAECAHEHRLAQARRMVRLWQEWKAKQN
jgi:hypothetical protein